MMLKTYWLWLLMTLFTLTPTAAQDDARFGSGIVLLNPPEDGLFFEGVLSPDGQFAAGAGITDMNIYTGTQLHLWDLRTIDREGRGVQADILRSFDLSAYADSLFNQRHMAFSPDSLRLAVLTQQAVLLLTIPEFEVTETIVLEGRGQRQNWGGVAWSPDSRLLAVSDDKGLMVWDGTKTYTAANETVWAQAVFYFAGGWLVDYESGFTFCTALLEACDNYDFENPVDDLLNAGNTLITDSQKLPAVTWTQNAEGIFRASPTPYSDVEGSLSSVSPDGRYQFFMRWTEGGHPDYPYYVLYEGETELYELDSHQIPIWLGTSGYFVQGNDLFHVDAAQPIDYIRSFTIEGVADSELGMWPEYLGGESVSADGRWYMKNLGTTALVVPIHLDN